MAIPHWTWPDHYPESAAADLADATDAFDVLSDPTRAAILGTLFDADTPLSYTDLAAAVDVADNGRLNYHLRRLGTVIERSTDGYVLTDRGRRLVGDVIEADTLVESD